MDKHPSHLARAIRFSTSFNDELRAISSLIKLRDSEFDEWTARLTATRNTDDDSLPDVIVRGDIWNFGHGTDHERATYASAAVVAGYFHPPVIDWDQFNDETNSCYNVLTYHVPNAPLTDDLIHGAVRTVMFLNEHRKLWRLRGDVLCQYLRMMPLNSPDFQTLQTEYASVMSKTRELHFSLITAYGAFTKLWEATARPSLNSPRWQLYAYYSNRIDHRDDESEYIQSACDHGAFAAHYGLPTARDHAFEDCETGREYDNPKDDGRYTVPSCLSSKEAFFKKANAQRLWLQGKFAKALELDASCDYEVEVHLSSRTDHECLAQHYTSQYCAHDLPGTGE
jgi:hypothetical protein